MQINTQSERRFDKGKQILQAKQDLPDGCRKGHLRTV